MEDSIEEVVRKELLQKEKEKLERLEKETEHIRREIDAIENSFWMKIERSVLWFIFPWTTFIKRKRRKKIEEIKRQNREILEDYERAKRSVSFYSSQYLVSGEWMGYLNSK